MAWPLMISPHIGLAQAPLNAATDLNAGADWLARTAKANHIETNCFAPPCPQLSVRGAPRYAEPNHTKRDTLAATLAFERDDLPAVFFVAHQEPRAHVPFALEIDFAGILENEIVVQSDSDGI